MNIRQQIANTKKALEIAQQADRLDLNYYQRPRKCGTIYCLAGWLCESEHFQQLGWSWDHIYGSVPVINGVAVDAGGANYQFGTENYYTLFSWRGQSEYDTVTNAIGPDPEGEPTDKEVAINRLQRHIAYLEAQA